MTNKIDTSPARLRALADWIDEAHGLITAAGLLHALADEKEAAQCSDLCHPEEPCSISADGKCHTCGSDCNERDELIKAEREIEQLKAAQPKPAPVLLTDEECQQLQHGCFFNGWLSGPLYARAIEAAVIKKNGIGGE
jgi:hypothetical protein